MSDPVAELRRRLARRHHRVGWAALVLFVALGLGLEGLHGVKAPLYLDPPHRVRRLMWTLAHAHGAMAALVNVAFAAGLVRLGRWTERPLRLASFFLLDALSLLPLGFFLGGFGHTEVDPGPGILLVPVGGLLLLAGVALVARAAGSGPPAEPPDDQPEPAGRRQGQ